MRKTLKVFHLIGMAMFLGSILAHIAAGRVPESASDPAMAFARQAIVLATTYVTAPGLGIAILSGVLMALHGPDLLRRRWLMLHVAGAAAIAIITMIVMVPIGKQLLEAALALSAGAASPVAFVSLLAREHAFGAVNIALLLVIIVLGAVKPRLRQTHS